ncbi:MULTISPECIES: YutD family protein [Paenibacillus]|uniref:YutD family protein n=1 Tax=Paenibacillus TaxID=44249 RepID=UPI0003868356|nr:hypothetical protein PAAL66ix_11176 [Paenibacillus alvei A6-6i-x]SDF98873.1 Uncharacterized protein YutD [Paenibacillus sp. cl6col]
MGTTSIKRAPPFVLEPAAAGEGGITDVIQIGGRSYEVIHEYKNAWNPEAFKGRYSEVLERYDYILGDWGYNQLRLKGFFRDTHAKSTKDSALSGMMDYINEYCNFGCAYFILERVGNKDVRVRTAGDQGDEAEQEGAAALEAPTADLPPQQPKQGIVLQPKQNNQDAAAEPAAKPSSSERKPRHSRNRNKQNHGKGGTPNQAAAQPRPAAESKERAERVERAPKEVRS